MLWRKPDLSPLPYFALAAIIAGLLLNSARAMSSMAIMVLAGYFLLFSNPLKQLPVFFRDPVLILLTCVFFLYLVSGLNSTEDPRFFWERVRIKLPFLALPVSFTVFRNRISPRQFHTLLYLFLFLAFFTSLQITISFYRHIADILIAYSQGRIIETPFNHIRYSLMTVFAVVAGFYLFQKRFFLRYPFERWIIFAASIFLIFFIHLLAVRSGILALYLCTIFMIFYFVFRQRNVKVALGLVLIIILLPLVAYFSIPSIRMKINYMHFDLEQLIQFKNASGLSDAGRIMSLEKGMEIFHENWLTGTGIGDLGVAMREKLGAAPENPRDKLLPHNQFLFVAAGTGIFGLIAFVAAVFLPLMSRKHLYNWLYVCFHIIIISSFFTEATVEEHIGTVFYLTFLLLMYVYIQSNDT